MSDPSLLGKVQIVGPDGKRYQVSQQEAESAFAEGIARPASQEELAHEAQLAEADSGIGNNVAAQGLALARGATFGLSDRAVEGLGLADKEQIRLLQEANADETGVAEFAGMAGTSVLLGSVTGGLGAGYGLVGRVATQAGIEGAMGAVDAATRQVNDDWLNDREISAERILAASAEGFALSAVFGGAGVLAESGAKAASRKAREILSPERKYEMVADAVLGGSAKAEKKAAMRFGDSEVGRRELGKILDEENVLGKTSAESLKNVEGKMDVVGGDLAALYRRAEEAGAEVNAKELRKELLAIPDRFEQVAPDIADVVRKRVRGITDGLFNTSGTTKALDDLSGNEFWADAVNGPELKKAKIRLEKIKKLDPADHDIAALLQKDVMPMLRGQPEIVWDSFEEARKSIDAVQSASSARKLSVTEIWDLRKEFEQAHKLLDPTQSASKEVLQDLRNAFQGRFMKDLTEAVPEIGEQIKATNKRYAALVVANEGLSHQASKVQRMGGSMTQGVGAAAAGAIAGSVLGAGPLAGGLFGLATDTLRTVGKDSAGQMAPRLLQGAIDAEKRFSSFVDKISGATSAQERAGLKAAYQTAPRALVAADIEQRRSDLQASIDPAGAAYAQASNAGGPELAAAQDKLASYLLKQLPSPPGDHATDPWARFDAPRYSPSALEKYRLVERAAIDPVAALERIALGKGRPEEIETIREVYPKLFARAQQQVAARVATMPQRPGATTRKALERFLNLQTSPQFRTFVQTKAKEAAVGRQAEAVVQAGAGGKMNSSDSYATVSSRLDGGIGR
jgi:hypothetical protein